MDDVKRTQIAQQGVDFSTMFAAKYSHLDISGHVPLMRVPSAESTAGGKQATQHVLLEPRSGNGPVITIGQVNLATRSAKLRTYDCLKQLHALRFGEDPFVLRAADYQQFFDQLLTFTKKYGFQIDVETKPPDVGRVSHRPPAHVQGGTTGAWLFLLALVMGAVVAVAYLIYTGQIKP